MVLYEDEQWHYVASYIGTCDSLWFIYEQWHYVASYIGTCDSLWFYMRMSSGITWPHILALVTHNGLYEDE